MIVPFQFWKLIFAVFLLVTLQWAPHHDTGVVIFQFHYGAVYRAVNRSAPVLRGACTVIQRKGLGGVRCDERDGQCVEQEVDGKSVTRVERRKEFLTLLERLRGVRCIYKL